MRHFERSGTDGARRCAGSEAFALTLPSPGALAPRSVGRVTALLVLLGGYIHLGRRRLADDAGKCRRGRSLGQAVRSWLPCSDDDWRLAGHGVNRSRNGIGNERAAADA